MSTLGHSNSSETESIAYQTSAKTAQYSSHLTSCTRLYSSFVGPLLLPENAEQDGTQITEPSGLLSMAKREEIKQPFFRSWQIKLLLAESYLI